MAIVTGDRVVRAVAEGSDFALDVLPRLIAEPSVRGFPTQLPRALQTHLQDLDFEVDAVTVEAPGDAADPEWSPTDIPCEGDFTSLLTRERRPGAIVLFAHLDTEPPDPVAGWKYTPFSATTADGRMYGLGAADDKAGISVILGAVLALKSLSIDLDRVRVAFVHGKLGGALGTLPVFRKVGRPAYAIYCHPPETGHGLTELKVSSRGVAAVELVVRGYTPSPGEINTPISEDPDLGVNAIERAMAIYRDLRVRIEQSAGWKLSITSIDGGGSQHLVPDRCVMRLAARSTSGTVQDLERQLMHALQSTRYGPWLRYNPPSCRLVGLRANPATVVGDRRLLGVARSAIEEATKRTPTEYGGHAASDIRFPVLCQGTAAVGLGPTAGGFYGPDEWVDLASMRLSVEVLVRTVMGLVSALPSAS
jgi:acetylornithine deacetylase